MPKRKADVFAGSGSLAGILKRQRDAIEDGDPNMGRNVVGETPKEPETKKPNSPSLVLNRGYYIEKEDE